MKRSQLGSALMILLVLILGNPFHSVAQVNTATLSGVVTDPQGLAVKSATVTVINNATGAQRSIVTDDAGHYVFVGLPPGSYKMTVDGGPGFKALSNQDLDRKSTRLNSSH